MKKVMTSIVLIFIICFISTHALVEKPNSIWGIVPGMEFTTAIDAFKASTQYDGGFIDKGNITYTDTPVVIKGTEYTVSFFKEADTLSKMNITLHDTFDSEQERINELKKLYTMAQEKYGSMTDYYVIIKDRIGNYRQYDPQSLMPAPDFKFSIVEKHPLFSATFKWDNVILNGSGFDSKLGCSLVLSINPTTIVLEDKGSQGVQSF